MKKAISIFAAIVMAGVVMGQECPCKPESPKAPKMGQNVKGHGFHRAHQRPVMQMKRPEIRVEKAQKPLTLGGRPNIAPTKNIKFPQWAPKAPKMGQFGGKRHFGKRHFSFGPKTQKMGAKRPHFGKRHDFKAPLMGAKRPHFGQKTQFGKRHFTFGPKPQFGRPVQGGFSVNPEQRKNPHGAWKRVRGFRH